MKYLFSTCGRILAAILVLSVSSAALACVNTFKSNIQHYKSRDDAAAIAGVIAELRKAYARQPTLENTNDLGVGLLLTGNLDEAIKLFEEAEGKFPKHAKVAANLGTAFELKGNDVEALKWIREGVNRDASEHHGSEWLHARILDVKIALRNDPNWFAKNRVLALDFGTEEVPVAPQILPIENGRVKGAAQLVRQIEYQLAERTRYVRPPDPIIGDLYATAGDLAIAGAVSILDDPKSVFSPGFYYEQAISYGAPRADLVRKRLAKFNSDEAALPPRPSETKGGDEVLDYPVVSNRFAPKETRTNTLLVWLIAGTVITLLLVFAGWLVDRYRKRQAALNPPPPLPDID